MELLAGEVWQVSKRNSQYFRSYLRKTTGGGPLGPLSGARVKNKVFLTKNDPKVLSPAPAVVDFQLDCGCWNCDCGCLTPALNMLDESLQRSGNDFEVGGTSLGVQGNPCPKLKTPWISPTIFLGGTQVHVQKTNTNKNEPHQLDSPKLEGRRLSGPKVGGESAPLPPPPPVPGPMVIYLIC